MGGHKNRKLARTDHSEERKHFLGEWKRTKVRRKRKACLKKAHTNYIPEGKSLCISSDYIL